jgi:hypothetical protein
MEVAWSKVGAIRRMLEDNFAASRLSCWQYGDARCHARATVGSTTFPLLPSSAMTTLVDYFREFAGSNHGRVTGQLA